MTAKQKYLKAAIGYCFGREELVTQLESIGTACYDDEPIEDLIDSFIHSVECGDLYFNMSYATSLSMPHHIKMLWFDI